MRMRNLLITNCLKVQENFKPTLQFRKKQLS